MKKVMIILMVALFVTALPAYGRNLWVGDPITKTGSFHVAANWADGYVPRDQPGFNAFEIRNGGTILIYEGDVFLPGRQIRIGYWETESGHVELNADVLFTCATQGILTGEYVSRNMGFAMGTFTQNAGTVVTDYVFNARTDTDTGGYGYGGYIVTGGTLQIAGYIKNGDDTNPLPADKGLGLFKVVGDAAAITVGGDFLQNAISTLEIVLTGAGNVSLIPVGGDATLAGFLKVDASAFAGIKTVDILTAAGALDYSGLSLDPANVAAGYVMGDDGAGTLQVTVPEPATLTLLGLGGLGVLLRRRKK